MKLAPCVDGFDGSKSDGDMSISEVESVTSDSKWKKGLQKQKETYSVN